MQDLEKRADGKCELCGADTDLHPFTVLGGSDDVDAQILICDRCEADIKDPDACDANRWRFLSDTMWSEIDAIKVQSYKMLQNLRAHGWPQDLLDIFYLDEHLQQWAQSTNEPTQKTLDSNGSVLEAGDSVTVIKDLDVKGAGFVAKRGTVVKNISLTSNSEQIEGRVNGVKIVLLSKFLKKSS